MEELDRIRLAFRDLDHLHASAEVALVFGGRDVSGLGDWLDRTLVLHTDHDPWAVALRRQYRQELAGDDGIEPACDVREYSAALQIVDPERDEELFYLLVQALCETILFAKRRMQDLEPIMRVDAVR